MGVDVGYVMVRFEQKCYTLCTMSVVQVSHLRKNFGSTWAVNDISFSVEQGEVFGFLGPNGAGKTTTIRCLMDFIRPSGGSITMLGKDAHQDSVALKGQIGYLSGSVRLYSRWTGRMHIDFARTFMHQENDMADELMKRFDFNPDIKIKQLSSGNVQKLGIILAFMHRPKLLIMDEPTNALDPLLQNEVYQLIAESTSWGATVFMSSHNLAEVERVCSRVGVIKRGTMVTTESIASLKGKRLYTVTAFFNGPFDRQAFQYNGFHITREFDHGIELTLKGDINPLIALLQRFPLRDVQIEHASLEDIFLEFYE